MRGLWSAFSKRTMVVGMITLIVLTTVVVGWGVTSLQKSSASVHAASNDCRLNAPGGNIQHVIYIQFDNVHFTRDNPNVPSDLEQMPNLLNFIKNNGVMLTNDHTPLIAHTANDILTSLTGLYPDRHGVPVANSYRYFNPDGTSNPAVSFAYWTSPLFDPSTTTPTDTNYNMITAPHTNTPAPWVPYTRAGCNVGGVATANIELENTGVDVPTVFGANSPQATEAKTNPTLAQADFVGIAIHCAKGSALCSSAHNGEPDRLPNEPGGYTGYMGLFGHKYVAPQISPNGPLTDLNGNVIKDPSGNVGFPGFDGMSAAVSLSYVASMQEHGVPVTYAYISDAHDKHPSGPAYGPGEAGYVAALKAYNDAFGKFFTRLAHDGITARNTLFVVTADENDHFVGGPPSPANCNGVTVPCTYSKIGEINANMTGLLATQQHITTPFAVHADSAPTVYITGNPARTASVTRTFERGAGALTATNPITGKTDKITNYMADPVEMKLLHMITADPARTPTFTLFANPDYFLFTDGANCNTPCVTEVPTFAWNHGDVSPDINRTWLGMVGPGVQHLGVNNSLWADHTDVRPTMMELLGLKDDYRHDGRVLFEVLTSQALPPEVREHLAAYVELAQFYKQIDAPVGRLGLRTLQVSTKALESNAPNDSTYTRLENRIQAITALRNTIAGQIIAILESAEFGGHGASQQTQGLVAQSNALLHQADTLN
jgi:hypothetical protein